jgi:hypothetical protein
VKHTFSRTKTYAFQGNKLVFLDEIHAFHNEKCVFEDEKTRFDIRKTSLSELKNQFLKEQRVGG